MSKQVSRRSSRQRLPRRTLAMIIALIVLVGAISTVSYVYFLPKDTNPNPTPLYHKILDTGFVTVREYHQYRSEYFVINETLWYVRWKDWQSNVPTGTQLEIFVYDAYTNHNQRNMWLDMNGTEYLSFNGVFYMYISIWPYSRAVTVVPSSFNATIEVWEAKT
jgi:hypothetical protein